MFIDTHVHLNSKELGMHLDEVISDAFANNVKKMIVVGYDLETSKKAIELAHQFDWCYAAVGFHPTEIKNYSDKEYLELDKMACDDRVIAIGEIGYDFHWDTTTKEEQYNAFIRQIDIAKKHNLKVIYDAAHVFGVEVNGRGIGSYGDISMFSFHATKVFNTIEGGALVYNNPELKKQIDSFKNFGIIDQEHVIDIGINSKMNEFQAAMGLCNLRHFDEEIAKREKVYNVYTERLSGVPGITISKTQKGVKPNFAYYPVIFDETVFGKTRDEISEELAKENIFSRKYFYPLISDYDCYRDRFDSKKTPVAKRISNRVLTIPMYANLSVEDANKICDIILKK